MDSSLGNRWLIQFLVDVRKAQLDWKQPTTGHLSLPHTPPDLYQYILLTCCSPVTCYSLGAHKPDEFRWAATSSQVEVLDWVIFGPIVCFLSRTCCVGKDIRGIVGSMSASSVKDADPARFFDGIIGRENLVP